MQSFGLISTLASAILASHLVAASPVNAASFTQKFRDMPVRTGELCDDVAFAEGQRLAAYAQTQLGQSIQVIRAYCSPDRDGDALPKWQITVEYESAQRLPMVSTISSEILDHTGYKNAAECEANLEAEKTAFTTNTGLAPFLSYCRVPLFRDLDWQLEIIGFGTPAKRPFDTSVELFSTIQGHTRDSFVTMVSDAFMRQGIHIIHASFTNHFPYSVMSVRYYGSTRIKIQESNLIHLVDDKSCPAITGQITDTLNGSAVANYGVYCVKDTLTRSKFAVAALLPEDTNLRMIRPETIYDDGAACEASRQQVIDHYRNDLRRNVIAGYCTVDVRSQKFAVMLFEL